MTSPNGPVPKMVDPRGLIVVHHLALQAGWLKREMPDVRNVQ